MLSLPVGVVELPPMQHRSTNQQKVSSALWSAVKTIQRLLRRIAPILTTLYRTVVTSFAWAERYTTRGK